MRIRSWSLTSSSNFFLSVISMSEPIFHLIPREEWKDLEEDEYNPDSLNKECFIHFCEKGQIEKVIEFEEASREELVVLCVSREDVEEDLEYENGFPHLYRPLKIDEVEDIKEIGRIT